MTRVGAPLCAAALCLLAAPSAALAHAIQVRGDLPVPEWLFTWAAALVLLASFAALGALWRTPRLEERGWRPLPRPVGRLLTSPVLEVLAGAIGTLLLGVVVWSGMRGVETMSDNFAPTFVFVVFWLGLVPLSLLFGDVFRSFNPWRACARAVAWVGSAVAREPLPAPFAYPDRLGRWPAAVGLLAFAWLELVSGTGVLPQNVAVATLIYSVLTWTGMALLGIEVWTDRAEAFSVYFGLLARMSVLERRGRELGVRRPLSGLAALEPLPGTVPLLAVMIGAVSFDGLSAGGAWQSLSQDLRDGLVSALDLGLGAATHVVRGLGLLVAVALVLGCTCSRSQARGRSRAAGRARRCRWPSSTRSCRSPWHTRARTTSACWWVKGRRSRRSRPTRWGPATTSSGRPGGGLTTA